MDNLFSGKHVLVMGLGLHGGGVATARWLLKHGARVTVTDLKTKKELAPSLKKLPVTRYPLRITCVFGRHRIQDFTSADIVVRNPAVPRESKFLTIAKKHGAQIENEATLFFKHCRSKNIIGVTGTRGKSTTAAMIHRILMVKCQMSNVKCRAWLAGNIRTTPMLSIVDRVKPQDWIVLELSSWHLEDMDRQRMSPPIAVVTNVLPDHLNRYTSMRSYVRAKETIVRYQEAEDIAVLNKENTQTKEMAQKTKAKIVWFSTRNFNFQFSNFKFFGMHNTLNARAAASVCHALGVSKTTIYAALKTFRGLPGRLELVRTVDGVCYYNDTTATTPDATIAALQTVSQKHKSTETKRHKSTPPSLVGSRPKAGKAQKHVILIAGGSDKNLKYTSLAPWIKKTCKAVVLLPGTATEKIKKLLNYPITQLPIIVVHSMVDAVNEARAYSSHGDAVILSPAAASFGLFVHEFDRGEQFVRAVHTLKNRIS